MGVLDGVSSAAGAPGFLDHLVAHETHPDSSPGIMMRGRGGKKTQHIVDVELGLSAGDLHDRSIGAFTPGWVAGRGALHPKVTQLGAVVGEEIRLAHAHISRRMRRQPNGALADEVSGKPAVRSTVNRAQCLSLEMSRRDCAQSSRHLMLSMSMRPPA